jgi:hypothetical protein
MSSFDHSSKSDLSRFQAHVMAQACAVLPRLRAMSEPELSAVLTEVDAINQAVPLAFMPGQRYVISAWDTQQAIDGIEIVALLVFGLWVQAGESEADAEPLLRQWPSLLKAARSCL